MKIGFLLSHPTQFEGPFFQYAARDASHEIHVIYADAAAIETFDPELSSNVSWGIDLLTGYLHAAMPRRGRLRWLLKEIRRQNYDLLIINGYARREYIFAALCGRLLGVPTALRLDSVQFGPASKSRRLLKKILFLGLRMTYRHFFAVGGLTVKYLENYRVKKDRISLLPYAIDTDYFRKTSRLSNERKDELKQLYGLPRDGRVVLSVAKFNEREAPWDLLRAFCAMPSDTVHLLLVGDGEQRSALESYARQHSGSQVVFTGYIPYPNLPALYGIADIFVHPAHYEPWGVSVHEALACGLPVIASSRVGAGHDLIAAGKNGEIYEVGNTQDLKEKLSRFLSSNRRKEIRMENESILSRWDYASTWRNIIEAGEKYLSFQP